MIKFFIVGVVIFVSSFSVSLLSCVQSPSVSLSDASTKTAAGTDNVEGSSISECEIMPFRFVILSSLLQSESRRLVKVFLDPRDYSLVNLKHLFDHVSKGNPEPGILTIEVFTDWQQLQFPSDCPGTGSSGNSPDVANKRKFNRAIYFRRGENIYFYYSEKPGTEKLETYVISGRALGSPIWP